MQILKIILAFFFLCSVGSFIGVCASRIPKGENIVKGRSHCDSCGRILKPFELNRY